MQARKLPTDAAIADKDAEKSVVPAIEPAPRVPPTVPPPPGTALEPPVQLRTASARKQAAGGPPPPPPSIRKPRLNGLGADEPFSEQDTIEVEVIRRLLTSYFEIVKTKIVDSVPKAVTLKLVTRVREELHDALVADLYHESKIDTLLDENADTAARRKKVREVIALLEASQTAIVNVQSSFTL